MMLTSARTTWLSPKGRLRRQTEGPHTWLRSQSSPRAHAPYAGSGVGEEQELATHVETKAQSLRRQHFCPGVGFISLRDPTCSWEWWLLGVLDTPPKRAPFPLLPWLRIRTFPNSEVATNVLWVVEGKIWSRQPQIYPCPGLCTSSRGGTAWRQNGAWLTSATGSQNSLSWHRAAWARLPTHPDSLTHTCAHSHTPAPSYAHIPHTQTHVHTYVYIHSHAHTHPNSCTHIYIHPCTCRASLIAQLLKNLPAVQETPVQFLGREDLLEKR